MVSVLTIAGSDPSGGAGIEADLEMFARAGVSARTAITALTVQRYSGSLAEGEGAIHATPSDVLRDILKTHSLNLPDAVKIGMIATRANLEIICDFLERHSQIPVVFDPVLKSTSGLELLETDALPLLKDRLWPRATIVTPNLDEVGVLLGRRPETIAAMEAAAKELQHGNQIIVVKGGHLHGDPVDVVWDGTTLQHLKSPRIISNRQRGTGCRLASAIAACLAQGDSPIPACHRGKDLFGDWIYGLAR